MYGRENFRLKGQLQQLRDADLERFASFLQVNSLGSPTALCIDPCDANTAAAEVSEAGTQTETDSLPTQYFSIGSGSESGDAEPESRLGPGGTVQSGSNRADTYDMDPSPDAFHYGDYVRATRRVVA